MTSAPREMIKKAAGWLISRSSAKFHFRNGIFILAHMRCGSTALSNILCSRADVSGYGEAHIRYGSRSALGRLAINQRLRGAWDPQATYLFDKVLHSRHDVDVPREFFDSRAIFMARAPEPAIRSIHKLFADLGRNEYTSHAAAGEYYADRLEDLAALWDRYDPARRIGVTHEQLLGDPQATLKAISDQLAFNPPLENRYHSSEASRRGGGGDPMQSGLYSQIEPALLRPARRLCELELPQLLEARVLDSYEKLLKRFANDAPESIF